MIIIVVLCCGVLVWSGWSGLAGVFSILGWEQKRSGKAARVMQEAADSWERLGATGSEWDWCSPSGGSGSGKRSEAKASPLPRLCWMCFCLLVDDEHLRQGPQGPVGNNADTPVRDWPPVRPSTERLRDDEVDRARSGPAADSAEVRRRRRAQL